MGNERTISGTHPKHRGWVTSCWVSWWATIKEKQLQHSKIPRLCRLNQDPEEQNLRSSSQNVKEANNQGCWWEQCRRMEQNIVSLSWVMFWSTDLWLGRSGRGAEWNLKAMPSSQGSRRLMSPDCLESSLVSLASVAGPSRTRQKKRNHQKRWVWEKRRWLPDSLHDHVIVSHFFLWKLRITICEKKPVLSQLCYVSTLLWTLTSSQISLFMCDMCHSF